MLVVRGALENRQAIVSIGVQRFVIDFHSIGEPPTNSILPIEQYRALVDTGAQRTCLTRRTIQQENLRRHGNHIIQNVQNQNVHGLFMVMFGFWCEEDVDAGPQGLGRSYFGLPEPLEVIDIANNECFDAIIGMDILRFFDVHFYSSGKFLIELK